MLPQYKILQPLINKFSIIERVYKKTLSKYGILEREDKQVKMKVKLQYLDELGIGYINLDQKIRCALGAKKRTFDDNGKIIKGNTIIFTPIKNEVWVNLILNHISNSFIHCFFGIQTNIGRTHRATYTDMETDVCRIKKNYGHYWNSSWRLCGNKINN